MKDIKAASVQFNHLPGDKDGNMEIVRGFIERAADQHVDLLVFPEMCVTGYWHLRNLARDEIAALAEAVPAGPVTQELLELSSLRNMIIGVGLIEAADDGQLFNTYVVAMPNGEFARHRKLHCFISEHMASGDEFTVFDTPLGCRLGVLICYDCNLGENTRITALKGAEILLAPHQTGGCATPSPRTMGAIDTALWDNRAADPEAIEAEFKGPKGRAWLMRWLPARAHDNGMFLIFSNGVGKDDDEVRTGNAMILDCYGEILAETWKAADEMVVANLGANELDQCLGARWIQSRRPDLYTPLTERTGKEKDIRSVRFSKT